MQQVRAEFIRIVSPIIILFILYWMLNGDGVKTIAKESVSNHIVVIGGLAAVLVSMFLHNLYYLFIYQYMFTRIQDVLNKKTYRNYLSQKFHISRSECIELFADLRSANFFRTDAQLSMYTDLKKMDSAFIHTMYFCSIASVLFAMSTAVVSSDAEWYEFLSIALGTFAFGILLDKRYEKEEYNAVIRVDEKRIKEIVDVLFKSPGSTPKCNAGRGVIEQQYRPNK